MVAAIPFPDISPIAWSFEIGGFSFALRWYALAYIAGILIGWRLAAAALKRPTLWRDEKAPMTPAQLEDLMTWIVIGIIVGGRLGYVLFYRPLHYLQNPVEIPMIWLGGMAFHGGLIGVVVAVWLVSRKYDAPLLSVADAIALATPPALLLGRMANFVNAELWGRASDAPWAVIFPGEAAQACATAAGPCARHPSQLYEAGLEGLLLGAVMIWLAFGRGWLKHPGRVAGLFFAGYAAARFIVEFFRQPDAQFVSPGNPLGLAFHIDGWGLTMGQILSLPMLAAALIFVLAGARRAVR